MGALLGSSLAIAAAPLACFATLVLCGDLAAAPAFAAAAVVLAAAIGIALLWRRDLQHLSAVLHESAAGRPGAAAPAGGSAARFALSLPARLATEAASLVGEFADRAERLGHLLRTETTIVDQLPDPLLVLGPDRRITRANAAARAIFGAELAALLRHPGMRGAIGRALDRGAGGALEKISLTVPGPLARAVEAAVIRLDAPLSDGGAVIVMLSDRTREQAIERMRVDFIANASHELRTPLASLIGFIDTLRGPAADDPEAQARFLPIMAEQAARMQRLLDDLLSLARIETIEHQPPVDPVDLPALLARVVAAFEIRLAERRIRLDWIRPETLPPVPGDADQLEQVLQNLLDNAVKYGREGGVIRLSLGIASLDGPWPVRPGVVLSVADDGPGIPRRHLPRLTERFYRVDPGRSRAIGGTGLGLAIVKHIVNRHRGVLQIDSEEGAGASFRIWLPTK